MPSVAYDDGGGDDDDAKRVLVVHARACMCKACASVCADACHHVAVRCLSCLICVGLIGAGIWAALHWDLLPELLHSRA